MEKRAQRIIREITRELARNYRPQKVILFGSYAWGKPGEESDLDLLIIKRTRKHFGARYAEVRRLLRDIAPDTVMDILVLTPSELKANLEKGNYFIEKVLDEGKRLYG